MSKARKRNPSPPKPQTQESPALTFRYEDLCLAALVATLVATPLIPSEGVREGTQLGLLLLQLLILTVWSALRFFRSSGTLFFGWTSVAVAIFLLWQTLSTFITLEYGNARYSLNTLWQWYSFGIVFFLLRQLVRDRLAARALCSVMLGLSLSVATYGLFQYVVEYPALRRSYLADPEAVIAQAGVSAPAGSPQRSQFENRINSLEPTATFALTNSLAGCLLPWLTIGIGILTLATKNRPRDWRLIAPLTCIILITIACLLLTKSRAAWLAMAMSIALLAIAFRYRGSHIGWRLPVLVGGAIISLAASGYLIGGLDAQVLSEASKSLVYRIEYWKGSWGIIRDYPWFGCGPGNFQASYTHYKLPQASETVADPHSFIFEIWSTTGTPGLFAFLSVLLAFGWQLWQQKQLRHASLKGSSSNIDGIHTWPIYAGAVSGFPLAFVAGFLVAHPPSLIILPCGLLLLLVMLVLHRWTVSGKLPTTFTTLAITALLINLLAAGGIVFPGVGQAFWILLAISLCSPADTSAKHLPRVANGALCLGCISMLLWGYWTTILPSITCRAQLLMAQVYQKEGNASGATDALNAAATADPYSPEPKLRLTNLYFRQALKTNTSQADERFLQAAQAALQLDAQSQITHRQVGNMHLSLFHDRQDAQWLQRAIEMYQKAVQHYPNSNFLHAQLAWAYHLAGNKQLASESARVAQHLDQQMPHAEQQLWAQTLHEGVLPKALNDVSAAQRLEEILAP